MNGSNAVHDTLGVLSDPTRTRLLGLLERGELAVSELCSVVQLPQSTVSRHLKVLAEAGLVASRAAGTSRRYRVDTKSWAPATRRLWSLVREQVGETVTGQQDAHRLTAVLAQRRTRSEEYFSSAAGQWDRVRGELFGLSADLRALVAFLDPSWTVGDLGCGTGHVAAALAPFVRSLVAVDGSAAMLSAARKRVSGFDNVELRRGELEALPVEDGELDAAAMFLVLHYVAEPARALREAARALRRGGRLVVLEMMPHEREEYRQEMGHLWQGFSADQMAEWLANAGFGDYRHVTLPAEPETKGPGLFVAAAGRE